MTNTLKVAHMTEWICDSLITGAADAYLAELAKLAGNTHLTFQHEIEQLRKTQSQQEQALERRLAGLEDQVEGLQQDNKELAESGRAKDKRLGELEEKVRQFEGGLVAKELSAGAGSAPVLTKKQKKAVKQFAGWEKLDPDGHKLPAHAKQYAAVIDLANQLMWAVNPDEFADFPNPSDEITWYDAQKWLKSVNQRGWCGHKDWRLPNQGELKTLLLPEEQHELFIRQDIFTDISSDEYGVWSSSRDARYVCFRRGTNGFSHKDFDHYVRVVRSIK